MEADIIVESFRLTEQLPKVRYKYFIADGDLSEYSEIMQLFFRTRSSYLMREPCNTKLLKSFT